MWCKCFQKGEKSNIDQCEHWEDNLGRALVITCCVFKENKSLSFCTWCLSPPQAQSLARDAQVQQVLFLTPWHQESKCLGSKCLGSKV